jgi:1-deoxy-D-xylulose-5-phosphate reductoisomerase
MNKSISILGSTGSVGLSALSIIDKKRSLFKINILSANKNYKLICKQIQKYKPNIFIIHDQSTLKKVKQKFKNKKIILINNFNLINQKKKTDISISAIPGIAGLVPTILITKLSKRILIANKESVICGWRLIKKEALKNNTEIIPIDSEHYSIFKLLESHKIDEIKKIYITASGGPFLNLKPNQFKHIKPQDALKHPKWKMGKKISIDSSTLMNKILEFIEAQKLFNIPKEKLDILIHPNSLVHAIVELNNGLTKFIYHQTTMIIPLANAIFEGKININDFYNFKNKVISKSIENLTFTKVNSKIFPAIKLKNRANEYPSTSIILNASNEVLVDQFLRKKIPFLGIYRVIRTILNNRNYKKYAITKPNNINQINEIDFWARHLTRELIIKKYE